MITMRTDLSSVQSMLDAAGQLEDQLTAEAYRYFRSITPIKTGNARRNTIKSGDTVQAMYPYAARLDEGSSRQAPSGMSEPTLAHMEQVFDKLISDTNNRG